MVTWTWTSPNRVETTEPATVPSTYADADAIAVADGDGALVGVAELAGAPVGVAVRAGIVADGWPTTAVSGDVDAVSEGASGVLKPNSRARATTVVRRDPTARLGIMRWLRVVR